MEEFEYRLHHEDATVVANICDRLKLIIQEKLSHNKDQDVEEIQFLWKLLKSTKNPLTSISCAKIIAESSEYNHSYTKTLTSFISAAVHASCLEGIVTGICSMLTCMKYENYGVHKNQHPLVALLRSSPERVWPLIASQIQDHLQKDPHSALKLYKPVFVFAFCDPRVHIHLSTLRFTLMNSIFMVDTALTKDFLCHITRWLPLEICSNQGFQELVTLIMVPWLKMHYKSSAKAYLSSLALQCAKRGLNPTILYQEILQFQENDDLSVMILSELIETCRFDHLSIILNIIKTKDVDPMSSPFALGMVLTSILNLVTQPKW